MGCEEEVTPLDHLMQALTASLNIMANLNPENSEYRRVRGLATANAEKIMVKVGQYVQYEIEVSDGADDE